MSQNTKARHPMRIRPILLLLVAFLALAASLPSTQALASVDGETELFMQGPSRDGTKPTESSEESAQSRSTVATAGETSRQTSPQTGDPTSFIPLVLIGTGCGLVIASKVIGRRRNESASVPRQRHMASAVAKPQPRTTA